MHYMAPCVATNMAILNGLYTHFVHQQLKATVDAITGTISNWAQYHIIEF